jgi:hypothetical protein
MAKKMSMKELAGRAWLQRFLQTATCHYVDQGIDRESGRATAADCLNLDVRVQVRFRLVGPGDGWHEMLFVGPSPGAADTVPAPEDIHTLHLIEVVDAKKSRRGRKSD